MIGRRSYCTFISHATPWYRSIHWRSCFRVESVLNKDIDSICKHLHIYRTGRCWCDNSTSRTVQRVIRCTHKRCGRRRSDIPNISCLRKGIYPPTYSEYFLCESKIIVSKFRQVNWSLSKRKSSVFCGDIDSVLIVMLTLRKILILSYTLEMCIKFVFHYSYSVRSGRTSWIGAVVREPIFFIICAFSTDARLR